MWAAIWCVVVVFSVIDGVTTGSRESWTGTLFTLVFFTVMSWRFLLPSLSISPSPLAALTALGAGAVALHGLWIDEPLFDGFTSFHSWTSLVLALAASCAAIVAPHTGAHAPMTGELIFPLRDGRWRVVAGQGRILNHHWVAPEQREALDLVRVHWTGRSRRGLLGSTDQDFYALGTELVAPCAGTVIHAEDGRPDGVADEYQAVGNHVVIDNGHEHIVLAHLRLGTVSVVTGDSVQPGDRLGEVGNSGNSTEPHLHIHVEHNGQPRRIRFIDVSGRFGKGRVVSTAASARV
ncbi:M23 family metallopeptidase [Mycobacterium sp. BMJ-28]